MLVKLCPHLDLNFFQQKNIVLNMWKLRRENKFTVWTVLLKNFFSHKKRTFFTQKKKKIYEQKLKIQIDKTQNLNFYETQKLNFL